jgi:protein SCO1/2
MQLDSKPEPEVGVEERLGQRIPLDLPFLDEQGRELAIGSAITRPTLLFPVYFSCTAICSIMLANLAQAINEVPLELGRDYAVLAVSFDEEEEPPLALAGKGYFTRILRAACRPEWRFLTGEKEAIRSSPTRSASASEDRESTSSSTPTCSSPWLRTGRSSAICTGPASCPSTSAWR